jgi:hypothetical protein
MPACNAVHETLVEQSVVPRQAFGSSLRVAAASLLLALAARIAPGSSRSSDPQELLSALDRLARLDAEMQLLRRKRPTGWANSLAAYAAEAAELRRAMTLEFRRDERGQVFLVRGDSAVYHLPGRG